MLRYSVPGKSNMYSLLYVMNETESITVIKDDIFYMNEQIRSHQYAICFECTRMCGIDA